MNLSDKLIELRKGKGWSQEEFAEKLDVSRQAVSRWENETALPDAQNILRISKLFNVTVDYLLNDDYESKDDLVPVSTAAEKAEPSAKKMKSPYLIVGSCFIIFAVCSILIASVIIGKKFPKAAEAHTHSLLISVQENEIAPTCTAMGSYDEVVYCNDCNAEVLRTHRSTSMLPHQFQNKKCINCDEYQPSDGLLYMSNGDGTCTVDGGDCTDENIFIPAYSPTGDAVIQIKAYAFAGFKAKSVLIPETVTVIGEGAFQDCTKLESLNLPSKIKIIYPYTFSGCTKLNDLTIPSGVTNIGTEAFADCVSFESIVIPESVTNIGVFAFRNFSKCEGDITFEAYSGWNVYDPSGAFVSFVDFKNAVFKPVTYLTFKYSDCAWVRN